MKRQYSYDGEDQQWHQFSKRTDQIEQRGSFNTITDDHGKTKRQKHGQQNRRQVLTTLKNWPKRSQRAHRNRGKGEVA